MINDHDFFEISKKSNDILDANNEEAFQSISKLHVIKHHSSYFSNLKNKKRNDHTFKKVLNFFKIFFLEKKSIYSKHIKPADCVIISNIASYNRNKKFEDIYFGNLNLLLSNEGISTVKIYRNLTDKASQVLSKSIEFEEDIILSKKSYIFRELIYLIKTIYSFFKLKIFGNYKFIKENFIFSDFLTIPHNLRLRDQICELVSKIKPKIIIFTFEGHSWERILINKLRKISPDTIIAVYQFSGLIKNQNSIYRKVERQFKPDIIFATGEITKKIMQKNLNDIMIEILGSPKHYRLSKNQHKLETINEDNFLFVPEGTEYEIYEMLDFCIIAAEEHPKKKFIFRFHPLINVKSYLTTSSFGEKLKKLKNIIISNQDLNSDILISQYVIFRGSSVVFNALLNNKTPLYLNIDQIDCNPLYAVFPKKLIINKKNIFKNLEQFKLFEEEKLMLKDYCMKYFDELNPKIIKKIIKQGHKNTFN
jgi:hypothetical protein